jgi:hypothetical protein
LLGDWYANILFARPEQLAVCVSERTLLPIVVPAAPASQLGQRLAAGLGHVLAALEISQVQVRAELREMSDFMFGRTQNRRVLGSLNDLMFQLSVYLELSPGLSLVEASLKLSRTPLSAIGRDFPDRATRSLFAAGRVLV